MSYPIYTHRFLHVLTPNVWVYWTVPTGKRAVIKSILVVNGHDTISQGGQVKIGNGWVCISNPAPKSTVNIALTIAAYHGEVLSAFAVGSTSYIAVGGFLFDDPTGAVGPGGAKGFITEGDVEPVRYTPPL